MQTDFLAAVRQIAAERKIDPDEIIEAIKQAIRVGFRKDYPEELGATLEVEINSDDGSLAVYADKKVVDDVATPTTQISLADAQKLNKNLRLGDHVLVEITHTGDFGRVAAQAAKQVIIQKLRESEKDAVISQFQSRIGSVESVVIQRMDRDRNVHCELFRGIALMPYEEQIPGEFYKTGAHIKVLLKGVHEDAKGQNMIVSRADADFLRALFAMEVPEIASGTVEIMGITREAGSRSKMAVRSKAEGVDPIGSCVGQRGARINAVTNELKTQQGEEKIDIIPWAEDTAEYIANAIKPAEALEVKIIDEERKQALILVDDEKLSLAIGRDGQNVRLAAKLTGWNLDIQGINAHKSSGKQSRFDAKDEVEVSEEVEPKKKTKKAAEVEAESDLTELGLATRVITSLTKAGIHSKAELKAKIEAGEKIEGVGPKSIEEISVALK